MGARLVFIDRHPLLAERWPVARAIAWRQGAPWTIGANFLPSTAINQLEMWQAATFDRDAIVRELDLAASVGMNTLRVYLHDLLWDDPAGFCERIETFLTIAAARGLRTLFVLFDSCWDPDPVRGPQRPPIPGVHNSGWVQSPGRRALADPAQEPRLQAYIEGIVGAFARDRRILAWDVWNEPDNAAMGFYGSGETLNLARVEALMPKVFAWARAAGPEQPLTSGLWDGQPWNEEANLNPIQALQLRNSDILTFHDYRWPEQFEARVTELAGHGRPMICTEFLARGVGSTFDGVLPIARRLDVGVICWGLVEGRSQTTLPWDSWKRPYLDAEPAVWHHDVFRRDGRPYRASEVELIRALAA